MPGSVVLYMHELEVDLADVGGKKQGILFLLKHSQDWTVAQHSAAVGEFAEIVSVSSDNIVNFFAYDFTESSPIVPPDFLSHLIREFPEQLVLVQNGKLQPVFIVIGDLFYVRAAEVAAKVSLRGSRVFSAETLEDAIARIKSSLASGKPG